LTVPWNGIRSNERSSATIRQTRSSHGKTAEATRSTCSSSLPAEIQFHPAEKRRSSNELRRFCFRPAGDWEMPFSSNQRAFYRLYFRLELRIGTFSHSRAGGNPVKLTAYREKLGPRLRGHDVIRKREINSTQPLTHRELPHPQRFSVPSWPWRGVSRWRRGRRLPRGTARPSPGRSPEGSGWGRSFAGVVRWSW
jgi:hypothetical protein